MQFIETDEQRLIRESVESYALNSQMITGKKKIGKLYSLVNFLMPWLKLVGLALLCLKNMAVQGKAYRRLR